MFFYKRDKISEILKMRLTLVSIVDPSVKKTIEIPKEIVKNKASVQSEVNESAESSQIPQKKRQTSKSIIHG